MPIFKSKEDYEAHQSWKALMEDHHDARRFDCMECGNHGMWIEPRNGPVRTVTCENEHTWVETGVEDIDRGTQASFGVGNRCKGEKCGRGSTVLSSREIYSTLDDNGRFSPNGSKNVRVYHCVVGHTWHEKIGEKWTTKRENKIHTCPVCDGRGTRDFKWSNGREFNMCTQEERWEDNRFTHRYSCQNGHVWEWDRPMGWTVRTPRVFSECTEMRIIKGLRGGITV